MRRCYDPRDPAQSEHDPASWRPTDNPILVAAREVCGSVPAARIDWAAIARDADDFDRRIPDHPPARTWHAQGGAATRRSG